MSHTPADWVRQGLYIYGPKHPDSKHKNGRILIGQVFVGTHRADPLLDGGAERFPFDAEADARLIAAAPDLLEACGAALNYYEMFRDGSPVGDTERDDIATVKAAIAKANGE